MAQQYSMLWAGQVLAGANRKFGDEGDDAFFVLPSKDAAGVADGTGYWRNKGITSGPYTRSMMINTRNYMEDGFNPYDALEAAFQSWAVQNNYGSMTFCVGQVIDNRLYVVQLGDCGVLVIRNGAVVYRSVEQEHLFNSPYQLGSGTDDLDDAWRYHIDLESGDLVIFGSDGLFNNLYDNIILEVVNQFEYDEYPAVIALTLAETAYELSVQENYWSPFSQRKYEAGLINKDEKQTGGKPDDIAVVVGKY
tara:strand:- start:345 stop:1094 length:750 start_codon:yes stop_codon:yes gene_type:complete